MIVRVSPEAMLTAAKVVSASSVGELVPALVNSPARSMPFTAVEQVNVLTRVITNEPVAEPITELCAGARVSPALVISPPMIDRSDCALYATVPSAMYLAVPPPNPSDRLPIQASPAVIMWLWVMNW